MSYTPAVAIVIINQNGQILSLLRSESDSWKPLHWGLPGGHIDEGETPFEAAIRETKEECNLEVNPIYADSIITDENYRIYLYYAVQYSGDIQLSFEHSEYKWYTVEELLQVQNRTPLLYTNVCKAIDEMRNNKHT
jgi:8-oxo-dGTP pyrophosphatase MutT (NUDIX family)